MRAACKQFPISGTGWSRAAGAILFLGVLAAWGGDAGAAGTVTGRGRFERVKGRPQLGHVELYESNLFLCPDGGIGIGPSSRLGAPAGQAPRGDGYYIQTVPAGTYSILVNQPLFFIRPKVVAGVAVADGGATAQNIDLPIDYSTYFTDSWTTFDQVWIQTFTATGTSITGVSWKLAGTNAAQVEASIHADDGGANPAAWPRVSAAASKADSVAAIADNWVRWRSGEVPTVPGRRYAVKLAGVAGGDRKFAVFKRDKDANSYAGGRAHGSTGAAQNFDLNITVFSDNDSTAILYSKTTEGLGELRDGLFAGRWSQTFKNTIGRSLAAADVWAAGANSNWNLDFTFTVRRGGPTGPQVGPAKTTRAAFQAFGAGLHGVSYSPGEVPLVPGETYSIDFTSPEGFNPYVMNDARDAYPDGAGYQSGGLRAEVDLSMTIIVYTEPGGAVAGKATDLGTGAAIPGASITAVESGRTVLSGADGRYELRDLPAGTHTLRASKAGYSDRTIPGIVVRSGETTAVDLALEAQPCALQFRNPSFESDLAGWTRFGAARSRAVDSSGGGWFAGIVAHDGVRFHGNEINGCCLDRGGLLQQACAVPGRRYRASVWSNVYWITGLPDDAVNRIGIDPGGGTDPDGPVIWSAPDRQSRPAIQEWRRIEAAAPATGPVITIFLEFRQRDTTVSGNKWRINCFDLVEVEDLDAPPPPPRFRRGDCDGSRAVDISDAVFLLDHLFKGGADPGCDDACDANDDGAKDISDAIALLGFLFLGDPPPPGGNCGPDQTPGDHLGCSVEQPCL